MLKMKKSIYVCFASMCFTITAYSAPITMQQISPPNVSNKNQLLIYGLNQRNQAINQITNAFSQFSQAATESSNRNSTESSDKNGYSSITEYPDGSVGVEYADGSFGVCTRNNSGYNCN